MARGKNTLSAIQRDEQSFSEAKEIIYVVGIEEFARRANVGRTSMYKYLGRKGVNKTIDARINRQLTNEKAPTSAAQPEPSAV